MPLYEAVFSAHVTQEYMLDYISNLGVNCFVDRENAAVHFDDPAFASLVAWCAELSEGFPEGDPRWADAVVSSDQVLLFTSYCTPPDPGWNLCV